MAALTPTTRSAVTSAVRNTLTASDTFTYARDTNQVLELHNTTGAPLSATIKGTAPSAAYPIPGAGGTTADLSTGLVVNVPANASRIVHLDAISAYLTGTGVVAVTGGSTLIAILLQN